MASQYDGTNRFLPFDEPLTTFCYPKVPGDSKYSRNGYGTPPRIFTQKILSEDTVRECSDVFVAGANKARDVVNKMSIPKEKLTDPKKNGRFTTELRKLYPYALDYTAPKPGYPDRGLLRYLEETAGTDKRNGGDGDAATFLDACGNLLLCMPGQRNKSPIRTAYMEMIRAYARLRYDLTVKNNDALCELHEPKHGTIVLYKGFDKSAASFADLGAYGSTILGTLENDRNLLYCKERIPHRELMEYISKMPPRYRDLITPQWIQI